MRASQVSAFGLVHGIAAGVVPKPPTIAPAPEPPPTEPEIPPAPPTEPEIPPPPPTERSPGAMRPRAPLGARAVMLASVVAMLGAGLERR